jgi:hypothetical protein
MSHDENREEEMKKVFEVYGCFLAETPTFADATSKHSPDSLASQLISSYGYVSRRTNGPYGLTVRTSQGALSYYVVAAERKQSIVRE